MGNWNSGRRGRPPTPTALKLLRGNPGKRPINTREPQLPAADASFDRPPPELAGNRRARAEWRRVAPLMRACGLVSEAERTALTALCLEWAAYLEAQRELKHARCLKDDEGHLYRSPYVDIADRALGHCHRLWSELGLTPSGRARVARLPPAHAPRTSDKTPPQPASKWAGLI